MFTSDVLLQPQPTAVAYSALMGFSFGYRSGRDVIRVDENDHIPPGSGAIADWQRPSRSLSPYRAFFTACVMLSCAGTPKLFSLLKPTLSPARVGRSG